MATSWQPLLLLSSLILCKQMCREIKKDTITYLLCMYTCLRMYVYVWYMYAPCMQVYCIFRVLSMYVSRYFCVSLRNKQTLIMIGWMAEETNGRTTDQLLLLLLLLSVVTEGTSIAAHSAAEVIAHHKLAPTTNKWRRRHIIDSRLCFRLHVRLAG